MNQIFKNMLSQYLPTTKEEEDNATHEVMQQIALAGLVFRNALSRRDNTLLTVCFSLRTKQVAHYQSPAGTTLNTIKL
ncbi:hypothetical protein AGMMS50239_05900 [Bacteroidia bacterium]|nr:hypothetical protein FACS189426_12740 [Bacteroidia bacterium]GHT59383.1 hypothetical protein AGMMS50239_05900 [Bacteroidia bacterium]